MRIPAPAGATPGDVAVGPDGIVYVSDGQNGAVYRCRPGCAALEAWLPAGTFFSPQGMAVSASGQFGSTSPIIATASPRSSAPPAMCSGWTRRPGSCSTASMALIADRDGLVAIQNGAPAAAHRRAQPLGRRPWRYRSSRPRARQPGLGRAVARRRDRRPAGLCRRPAMGALRRRRRGDRGGADPAHRRFARSPCATPRAEPCARPAPVLKPRQA